MAARLREELYKQELDHAGISSVDRDGIRNRIRLYHAGQKEEERESAHQAFLASDCRLIVATVAFGMGVNKRNIRHVVHFGPPPSLENYVQEVGRAGRDSFWSECLLIHSQADWVVWRKRLEQESGRSREDETPMGRSKRKQRLERIRDRLGCLKDMERLADQTHCPHRLVEEYFQENESHNQKPINCISSCDYCRTPSLHLAQVDEDEGWLRPPPQYEDYEDLGKGSNLGSAQAIADEDKIVDLTDTQP